MKKISKREFKERFKEQLVFANFNIREDILNFFQKLERKVGKENRDIVHIFTENSRIARKEKRALCQDTGYVQVFVDWGLRASVDFNFSEAIEECVKEVYKEAFLRCSLADPISRKNTNNNTPVFIDYEIVPGENIDITIMLKGGGSENATRNGFLLPTVSESDIIDWVVNAVKELGAKACPPYLIGVCIGGNLEKAVYHSKKALLLKIGDYKETFLNKELSKKMLVKINHIPIGFQGLNFGPTAFDVKVKVIPCHIATLPIAVSIGCNSVRQGHFRI